MRKLFKTRNNRALSTVISTILMIMVVMIGMTLLFAYVTVYAQNYKEGVGGAVMESLTIEDVWFKDSTTLQISVYNAGKVDCQVNGIYNNGVALVGATNLNTPIKIGEHKLFVVNQPAGWPTLNNLKIVTVRSSEFTGAYNYPTEVR
jgi:FlaG/FlaF family flagellin (archaellin)